MRDFKSPFNGTSDISGPWEGDNYRLCETGPCLWLKRYKQELNPAKRAAKRG